jgi:hypothetical protein
MSVATFQSFGTGTGGCSEADKNYTFVDSTGLPSTATIGISELLLGNGDIQHTFLVTFNGATGVATLNGTLDYIVQINSNAVDIAGIDQVRFDTTTGVNPGENGTSVIQQINPSGPTITLTSTNGSAQGAFTNNEPQQLQYSDAWSITAGSGGSLVTSADTLIETNIRNLPEPASLTLVGLGLTVLGFMRRRKSS